MGWLASLVVGVVTAVVGMVSAGLVAGLAAGWYRMSSFEGASGYFVVAMALLGAIGGLIIGVVTSRVVAARARPGFLKATGLAQAVTIGILLSIGTVARLLADVPPRVGGVTQLLAVEIKWPEGQRPAPPGDGAEEWRVRLGSSSGHTLRASRRGPLWPEDARLDEGRWVVPGAVELFTSRGQRVLDVVPDGVIDGGFIVPLPGFPGGRYREWSEWLPRARSGDPPLPDGFRYRFRLVPSSEPIRTENFGPFEVDSTVSGFGEVSATGTEAETWSSDAIFRARYRGRPVTLDPAGTGGGDQGAFERFDAVAAVPAAEPALLVRVLDPDGRLGDVGPCFLVVGLGTGVRSEPVGSCQDALRAPPITSDSALFARSRDRRQPDGRFDRTTFSTPGQYLFRGAVLDTRDLSIQPFSPDVAARIIERIPPIGAAPDGRSFVRLAWAGDSDQVQLVVIDLAVDTVYDLAIDPARMRFADIDQIDPAWVLHHFEWEAGPEGVDRLVERAAFEPLPHRGTLTLDSTGYREYRLAPALPSLREALVEFLVSDLGAVRLPAEPDAFAQQVRIGDAVVSIHYSADEHQVGVWMDRGVDSSLVADIAARFDEALRSGRYDDRFGW